jgi:plasmid stability protein
MPTLYVENVPEELYEALRERARQHRKSLAAEVLILLEENVPTATELKRRKELMRLARKIRATRPSSLARFPTSEAMQREDRRR